MKLIKVKGIVIKEVTYKDNDKIITLLTDELGTVSCIAKGAKKTNSPILANAQYLVYSEFVLYKGSKFYYINAASVINMFYHLRIDFDKLETVFELTKMLYHVTDENQDTSDILQLFLNTIYTIENLDKPKKLVVSAFKIKLFTLLGFAPRPIQCGECGHTLGQEGETEQASTIYYDYVSNIFCCGNCVLGRDKRRYIELSKATLTAIRYVVRADLKKLFSFELKDLHDFDLFGQVYADAMTNGI